MVLYTSINRLSVADAGDDLAVYIMGGSLMMIPSECRKYLRRILVGTGCPTTLYTVVSFNGCRHDPIFVL